MSLYAAYACNEGGGTVITDYSGNGRSMTIAGSGNTWVTGHGSYPLAFLGGAATGAGASWNGGSADATLSADVTVMCWAQSSNGATTLSFAGGLYSAAGTARLAMYSYRSLNATASSPELTVRNSAGGLFSIGVNATTADASWHHIAAVYHSAGTVDLYLDGTEVVTAASAVAAIGTTVQYLGVGALLPGAGANSAVNDFRVFSSALAGTDVTTYMNTPVAGAAVPPGVSLVPPGLASPMAFRRQAWRAPAPLLAAGADSGSGADAATSAASVAAADAGSGAEAGTVTGAPLDADSGTGAEGASAAAAVSSADTGTGADGGTVTASAGDSDGGSGADAGTVAATASGADTGPGADLGAASASVAGADTGTAAEAAAVAVSDGDAGSGADSGYPVVPAAEADTGAGTDSGSVTAAAIAGGDTAAGADSAAVTASAGGADSGQGADSASAYQKAVLPPAARLGGSAVNASDYGGSAVSESTYGGTAE